MLPSFDMTSVVDTLAAFGRREVVVLLRSRDVVCRGGICLRSSFSGLVAVFVRDKVMWPLSDMVVLVLLNLDDAMLGVYAAQCYKTRPFMAPAQAARVSGARSQLCERGTIRVEGAVLYTVYTYFQESYAMRGIRGTAIVARGLGSLECWVKVCRPGVRARQHDVWGRRDRGRPPSSPAARHDYRKPNYASRTAMDQWHVICWSESLDTDAVICPAYTHTTDIPSR